LISGIFECEPEPLTFSLFWSSLGPPMNPRKEIAGQLLECGRRLEQKGFVAGSDGNISARLGPGQILVTPSGMEKGRLTEADLVVVNEAGQVLDGNQRPSSEIGMHLAVYRARPEISAVVHSHAPYATAFAAAGIELPDNVLPETVYFVGKVPLVPFAPPGTKAVGEGLGPYLAEGLAFLLANHGLLTIEKDLSQAYNVHETVEHSAKVIWLAKALGGAQPLPAHEIERLSQMRKEQAKK